MRDRTTNTYSPSFTNHLSMASFSCSVASICTQWPQSISTMSAWGAYCCIGGWNCGAEAGGGADAEVGEGARTLPRSAALSIHTGAPRLWLMSATTSRVTV